MRLGLLFVFWSRRLMLCSFAVGQSIFTVCNTVLLAFVALETVRQTHITMAIPHKLAQSIGGAAHALGMAAIGCASSFRSSPVPLLMQVIVCEAYKATKKSEEIARKVKTYSNSKQAVASATRLQVPMRKMIIR